MLLFDLSVKFTSQVESLFLFVRLSCGRKLSLGGGRVQERLSGCSGVVWDRYHESEARDGVRLLLAVDSDNFFGLGQLYCRPFRFALRPGLFQEFVGLLPTLALQIQSLYLAVLRHAEADHSCSHSVSKGALNSFKGRACLSFEEGADSTVIEDKLDPLQGVVKFQVDLAHSQPLLAMSLHVFISWPTERFAFCSLVTNCRSPFKLWLVPRNVVFGDPGWATLDGRSRW